MNKPIQPKPQRPEVIFQPKTFRHMQRGINKMVDLLSPTLGPLPRMVANDPSIAKRSPEILDNGATIMRRVVQIQNRDEDMGAMFIRHVLWEMFEKVGDGTATAGVLFRSIYNQGVRYITAGGNAMLLRGYLEEAGNAAIKELEQMTGQLEGKHALARLAETICYDPQLAKLMGEIFDVIGEYGRLEIRTSRRRELEREYIEGMYWDGGLFSREMLNDMVNVRAYLENAPILISDLDINEPQDVLPLLNMALENNLSSLVLMGKTISDRVLGLLLSETNRKKIEVMAVKTPGITVDDQRWALQDLAVLTGGSPLHRAAGDQLTNVRPDDLGKIRRVWANLRSLVIIGGRGDARLLRQHITELRKAHNNTKDPQIRKKYLERIGKLIGGSATLWIGDSSPLAVERRKEIAERTADAMRGALREGVVPGGGSALLACRSALQARIDNIEEDERRVAYSILIKALEEPARVIIDNAGVDSRDILADLRREPAGWGYDVSSDQIVNMFDAGICDSAAVTREAIFSAVHGAALALTTDVLVHRRIRPESIDKTG